MSNIIVDLNKEINRVRLLLPKLAAHEQRQALNTIEWARCHMALNSLEGMTESLADLRDFRLETKKETQS